MFACEWHWCVHGQYAVGGKRRNDDLKHNGGSALTTDRTTTYLNRAVPSIRPAAEAAGRPGWAVGAVGGPCPAIGASSGRGKLNLNISTPYTLFNCFDSRFTKIFTYD